MALKFCGGVRNSPPAQNSDFQGGKNGHPIVYWPGWINNDARYSVYPDIQPLPISPVHYQNWPEMQYQLSNGWQYTNYGQKMAYDDYLRMLYASHQSSPGAPAPLPGEGLQPQVTAMVSQRTLQNYIGQGAPNDNTNGAGALNPGVTLGRRSYYG